MNSITSNKKQLMLLLIIIGFTGMLFRLYHIEFGLPHSFHADEPEITEPAIKYTYEIFNIIRNNDWYKLIPVSFVYGTFPVYLFTIFTMSFSKTLNILNAPFDKTSIFIFLRVINSLISFLIIPMGALLYAKIFKDKLRIIITTLLLAFNWKLIALSHYVNNDTILTLLILIGVYLLFKYWEKDKDTKFTVLSGIVFGLAVGTKITALISLPIFLLPFISKKDYKSLLGFLLISFGAFAASNPFSVILAGDFKNRIIEMLYREGGLVFDSADYSATKYLSALINLLSSGVFLALLFGGSLAAKKKNKPAGLLILNITIYLLFFTVQSRKVDRWIVPVLPFCIIFSSYFFSRVVQSLRSQGKLITIIAALFLGIIISHYFYFTLLLLSQYQKDTPKSASYLWLREKVEITDTVLAVTEEGLDPINKIPGSTVIQFNVYESDSAQYSYPPDPHLFKYIVLASKPMSYYKNEIVKYKYPVYFNRWNEFENSLFSTKDFEMIKEFTLTKPNLANLSDVYIFKNLNML